MYDFSKEEQITIRAIKPVHYMVAVKTHNGVDQGTLFRPGPVLAQSLEEMGIAKWREIPAGEKGTLPGTLAREFISIGMAERVTPKTADHLPHSNPQGDAPQRRRGRPRKKPA